MLQFSLQRDAFLKHQPSRAQFAKWVRMSLRKKYATVMITVTIVDARMSQQINSEYRKQNKATNVISLEYADTRESFNLLSGELYLCDEVIVAEASAAQKTIQAHYAHMIIHGILHLQGYDHQVEDEAQEMEAVECELLTKLGYTNPYLDTQYEK